MTKDHIETNPLICCAGFYMIKTSVMRELRAREVSLKLRYNFPKVVLISPKLEENYEDFGHGENCLVIF